jgi:hypothetical protein
MGTVLNLPTFVTLPWRDMLDLRAAFAKAEIRVMYERARREIDERLGYPPTFTARSIAQRRRFARQRLQKEQS